MVFAFCLFLPLNFISGKDNQWLIPINVSMEKGIRKHECACIYLGRNNIHVNCRPQASELGSNMKNKERRQTAPRAQRCLDYHLDPSAEVQHYLVMLQKSWEKMILRN